MKYSFFLYLFLVFPGYAQNSQNQIDSLYSQLEILTGDELALVQIQLSSQIMTIDQQEARFLVETALASSEKSDFAEGKIRSRIILAGIENYQFNFNKSERLLKEAITLAETADFLEGLAYAYSTMGSLELRRGRYAEAVDNLFKGLEAARALKNVDMEVTNLLNIGLIKQRISQLDEAEKYLIEGFTVSDANGLDFRSAQFNVNLGVLEFTRNNIGKSIEYNKKALATFRSLEDKPNTAACLQNLGFANAALLKRGDAFKYYDESLLIRRTIGDQRGVSKVLLNKALLENKLNRTRETINLANESLSIAQSINDHNLIRDISQLLFTIYQEQNNPAKALEFQLAFTKAKDSIAASRNEAKIAQLTAQFEFDKQEKELAMSKADLNLAERESDLLRTRQFLLLIAVVFLILIILFLIRTNRHKLDKQKLESKLSLEKAKVSELQEEKLNQALTMSKLEVSNYANQLLSKNKVIEEMHAQLTNRSDEEEHDEAIQRLVEKLNTNIISEVDWVAFKLYFEKAYPGFFTAFSEATTGLTLTDERLAALLKIKLTNKEIANILGISTDSVVRAKYRLRQKLNLETNQDLESYFTGL